MVSGLELLESHSRALDFLRFEYKLGKGRAAKRSSLMMEPSRTETAADSGKSRTALL